MITADPLRCAHSKLASDEDFVLFSVAIFRRVRDEFAQKCRENKYVILPTFYLASRANQRRRFIVRDFPYDEEAMEKQRVELAALEVQEKELWVCRSSPSISTLTRTPDGPAPPLAQIGRAHV